MGYGLYEDPDAKANGVLRWAGYMVPGICDHLDCSNPLALGRGLDNKCETDYDEDDNGNGIVAEGCGLFFCGEHLGVSCTKAHLAFRPKPDTVEWEGHILSDDSWAKWREEHKTRVAEMLARSLA